MLKIWSMRPLAYMRGHYYIFLLPYCKRARLSQCCTASHCIGASCFCDGITLQKKIWSQNPWGAHAHAYTPHQWPLCISVGGTAPTRESRIVQILCCTLRCINFRVWNRDWQKKLMLQEVSHDFQTSISKSAEIKDTFSYTFPVWR